MKLFYPITITVLFLFFSCKKKDSPLSTNDWVPDPNHWYSQFQSQYVTVDSSAVGGLIREDSLLRVNFAKEDYGGDNHRGFAGAISVNGFEMHQRVPFFGYYHNNGVNLRELHWSIGGSNEISAFSFSYTTPSLKFAGEGQLPDTLSRSNFTFHIGAAANFGSSENDYANVFIVKPGYNKIKYLFSPVPSVVSVSSSEFNDAGVAAGSCIRIDFSVGSQFETKINDHSHFIYMSREYTKYVYLNP